MFKAFHADAALAPQPMSRPAPQAANAAQVSQQPQSRPVAAISEAEKPAASGMSAVQMLRRKAASTPKMAVSDGPSLDATSRPDTAFTSFKQAPAATPQKKAPAPVDPTLHPEAATTTSPAAVASNSISTGYVRGVTAGLLGLVAGIAGVTGVAGVAFGF